MKKEIEKCAKALKQIKKEQDEMSNRTRPRPISGEDITKLRQEGLSKTNFEDRKHLMIEKLSELPKSPGICMIIDMVESTKMKALQCNGEWMLRYFNFFSYANSFIRSADLDHIHVFVKSIRDGVFVYMPKIQDQQAEILRGSALISGVLTMMQECSLFAELHASMHYCKDVYYLELPDPDHPDRKSVV